METMCPLLLHSGTLWLGDDIEAVTPGKLLHLVSNMLPHLQVYWTNSFRTDNPYQPHHYDKAIAHHTALGQGMLVEICTCLEVCWLLTRVLHQPQYHISSCADLVQVMHNVCNSAGRQSNWMPPEKRAFVSSLRIKQKRRRATDFDATRRLLPFHAIVRHLSSSHSAPTRTAECSVVARDYGSQLRGPRRTLWTAVRLFVQDITVPHNTLDGWLLCINKYTKPPLPTRASIVGYQVLCDHEAIQRRAIEDAGSMLLRLVEAVRMSYDRSVWLWLQFRRLLAAGEHSTLRFLLDEPIAIHTFNLHFTSLTIGLDLLCYILNHGGWRSLGATRHIAAVAHTMLSC